MSDCVQEAGCVGSSEMLQLNGLISKKICDDCSDEMIEPIPLPEDGELEEGETIIKAGGELVTQVAQIG